MDHSVGREPRGALHVQGNQVDQLRRRKVHQVQVEAGLRQQLGWCHDLVHRHRRLQGRLWRTQVPTLEDHQQRPLPARQRHRWWPSQRQGDLHGGCLVPDHCPDLPFVITLRRSRNIKCHNIQVRYDSKLFSKELIKVL
jgi:hypothetical protein